MMLPSLVTVVLLSEARALSQLPVPASRDLGDPSRGLNTGGPPVYPTEPPDDGPRAVSPAQPGPASVPTGPGVAVPRSLTPSYKAIPNAKTTYKIIQEGQKPGPTVETHDVVAVHVEGKIAATGKTFWNTRTDGPDAFMYTSGGNWEGNLIKGWDVGADGMRVHEIRMLRIPPEEGFGSVGFPAWGIPPDAELTLQLEVEKIMDHHGHIKTKNSPARVAKASDSKQKNRTA